MTEYYYGVVIEGAFNLFTTMSVYGLMVFTLIIFYIKKRNDKSIKIYDWIKQISLSLVISLFICLIFALLNKLNFAFLELIFLTPLTVLIFVLIFKVNISKLFTVLLMIGLQIRYTMLLLAYCEPYGVPYTEFMFNLEIFSMVFLIGIIPYIMIKDIRRKQ